MDYDYDYVYKLLQWTGKETSMREVKKTVERNKKPKPFLLVIKLLLHLTTEEEKQS